MRNQKFSRRNFLRDSAVGVAAGSALGAALANPALAAAQTVGVKPADLPDFTIKEVKVYVVDLRESSQAEQLGNGRDRVDRHS